MSPKKTATKFPEPIPFDASELNAKIRMAMVRARKSLEAAFESAEFGSIADAKDHLDDVADMISVLASVRRLIDLKKSGPIARPSRSSQASDSGASTIRLK